MDSASSTETLAEIGVETMKLLKEAKAVDKHCVLPKALVAAESDRFELWAVNLGLFVSGHGSLDYRVREAESLESTLRRFMNDLNESLTEVLEYGTRDKQSADQDPHTESPFDEFERSLDDTSQNTESDLDLLLDSVRDPIDRLYKLSTGIRNPSSRFASAKAQRHQEIDQETGVDLLEVFKTFDYDYISSLFLQYRKLKARSMPPKSLDAEPIHSTLSHHQTNLPNNTESFLIRRIARANIRRRQQFAYWKKHRGKLSQHSSAFTNSIDVPPPILPAQSITTASRLNITQADARDGRSTVSVSEYTSSSASKYTSSSEWQLGQERVVFPDPPKQRPGEKFFECPFCFTLCSTDTLARKAWKAHLIHDLRPYICTYEDCRNPDQQYDRREDWISHENSSHRRVWRCPEHPDQIFLQFEGYQDHLRSEHSSHGNGISENLMSNVGEFTLTTSDRCCPICLWSTGAVDLLQRHIALHLERFSVFSLPRSVDANADVDENDSNEANIAFEGSRDEDFNLASDEDADLSFDTDFDPASGIDQNEDVDEEDSNNTNTFSEGSRDEDFGRVSGIYKGVPDRSSESKAQRAQLRAMIRTLELKLEIAEPAEIATLKLQISEKQKELNLSNIKLKQFEIDSEKNKKRPNKAIIDRLEKELRELPGYVEPKPILEKPDTIVTGSSTATRSDGTTKSSGKLFSKK